MRGLASLLALSTTASAAQLPDAPLSDCSVAQTITIPAKTRNGRVVEGTKRAYRLADGSVMFVGKFTVDADGSPRAYHPVSARGQDALGNAGRPGNWWAIATDTRQSTGRPVVQGAADPAPGFHVSMTSMTDPSVRGGCGNQRQYVNSDTIPYAAIPEAIGTLSRNRGRLIAALPPGRDTPEFAVHADQPPAYGVGEGSMELARRLGYSPNPRRGGTSNREIVWLVMNDRLGFPRDPQVVEAAASSAFERWGGGVRLRTCAAAVRALPL